MIFVNKVVLEEKVNAEKIRAAGEVVKIISDKGKCRGMEARQRSIFEHVKEWG